MRRRCRAARKRRPASRQKAGASAATPPATGCWKAKAYRACMPACAISMACISSRITAPTVSCITACRCVPASRCRCMPATPCASMPSRSTWRWKAQASPLFRRPRRPGITPSRGHCRRRHHRSHPSNRRWSASAMCLPNLGQRRRNRPTPTRWPCSPPRSRWPAARAMRRRSGWGMRRQWLTLTVPPWPCRLPLASCCPSIGI